MTRLRRIGASLAALTLGSGLLVACSSTESPESPESPGSSSGQPTATAPSSAPPTSAATSAPSRPPDTVSIAALQAATHEGSRLRLGAVRERTTSYTSRDVTYRVTTGGRTLTISGVLNVPSGPGPFPAVVLAHGYIDPAGYVRGQGMTRERGVLASAGMSRCTSTTAGTPSPPTTHDRTGTCGWATPPT